MKRVLLIEDNEDNRVLITRLLERSGFSVTFAATGRSGYEMAVDARPDFILLDIQLPDMDGIEVLTMLRDNPESKGIPVIAVTSLAMSGDRDRLLSKGCNGYIEKPIDPLTVVPEIQGFLESLA
jgi:two-component system cell cycle response regulator DivK